MRHSKRQSFQLSQFAAACCLLVFKDQLYQLLSLINALCVVVMPVLSASFSHSFCLNIHSKYRNQLVLEVVCLSFAFFRTFLKYFYAFCCALECVSALLLTVSSVYELYIYTILFLENVEKQDIRLLLFVMAMVQSVQSPCRHFILFFRY